MDYRKSFYSNEFSIGNMLPQIPLGVDHDVICRGIRDYVKEPNFHYKFDFLDDVQFEPIQESVNETKYPVYIMLIHSGSLLANAIKAVTQSQFSHSSISFDSSMTNMYSFARKAEINPFIGGFKQESIKSPFIKGRDIPYALYMVLCTKSQIAAMKKRLDYFIQNESKFKYDFTGLFKNYFRIVDNPEYKWFCSRFVADIINAGYPVSSPVIKDPSLVRPEDFKSMPITIYVTGGNLKYYNRKRVDEITQRILNQHNSKREDKQYDFTESAIITQPDIEINLDEWRPDGKNILYITGLSGSGKSTLAKKLSLEYSAEYIEMDRIITACFLNKSKAEKSMSKFSTLMQEYWSSNRHFPIVQWGDRQQVAEMTQFNKWLVENHKSDGKLYILEGCQIIDLPPAYLITQPLIIKGTSSAHTLIRRFKRKFKKERDSGEDLLHSFIAGCDSVRRILARGKLFTNERLLNEFKFLLDRARELNYGTDSLTP